MHRTARIIFCTLGIFIFYFLYGILQERITRGKYGADNEKYTYIIALVFIQCFVNAIYAKIVMHLSKSFTPDYTKQSYYAICSFTYLTAMVSSNKALKWVSYPAQVVGKSCKPIPVLLLSVILGKQRYSLQKYLFVILIVSGVSLFLYEGKSKIENESHSNTNLGNLLLIFSLLMDGLTAAVQERMRAEFKTKSGPMMLTMNLWSLLYSGIATEEFMQFYKFSIRHPIIIFDILLFCIASAMGQYFIFISVSEFGPLVCSIITTTRKFFTVLGSVFIFGNILSLQQWIGATFVFSGLILDSLYSQEKKSN